MKNSEALHIAYTCISTLINELDKFGANETEVFLNKTGSSDNDSKMISEELIDIRKKRRPLDEALGIIDDLMEQAKDAKQ